MTKGMAEGLKGVDVEMKSYRGNQHSSVTFPPFFQTYESKVCLSMQLLLFLWMNKVYAEIF